MQRLQGDGWAFMHAGGTIMRADARPGRDCCASTPAASSPFSRASIYDIQFVGKIKSALFGGEGLFFATLRGPGRSGCNPCRSAAWPTASSRAAPQTGGAARGRLDPRRLGPLAGRRQLIRDDARTKTR